ncbi:hypothetical protein [Nonomuraea rubra]|uniref:hypothetical protein n=1 Tax=Nonomuraea rubra TaxID=46180 RepID=UPI0031E68543
MNLLRFAFIAVIAASLLTLRLRGDPHPRRARLAAAARPRLDHRTLAFMAALVLFRPDLLAAARHAGRDTGVHRERGGRDRPASHVLAQFGIDIVVGSWPPTTTG